MEQILQNLVDSVNLLNQRMNNIENHIISPLIGMELFADYIDIDNILIHENNSKIETFNDKPIWVNLEKDSKNKYGNIINKFKPKKRLKLLNINNSIFHNDFIDRLNKYLDYDVNEHSKNEEKAIKKIKILNALGIMNIDDQINKLLLIINYLLIIILVQ